MLPFDLAANILRSPVPMLPFDLAANGAVVDEEILGCTGKAQVTGRCLEGGQRIQGW